MFCVQLAGVLFAVDARYSFTERLCADYIVDASPNECDFAVSATPEEIVAENDDTLLICKLSEEQRIRQFSEEL